MVKDAPATKMLELSAKLLRVEVFALKPPAPPATTATPEPVASGASDAPCCGGGPAQGAAEPVQIGTAPTGVSSCC